MLDKVFFTTSPKTEFDKYNDIAHQNNIFIAT